MDNSGNLTANASLSAKAGVGGGIYNSGLSASGASGLTCWLSFTNGGGTGATASVALPFVGGTSALNIMSTGYGYTSPPSLATVIVGGTATACTGTAVMVTTYLNGVINMAATSKPGGPPTGNGSIWFDIATSGDWPLPVPMGTDSTGTYTSAMVLMGEGSSTGPYYWGVGGAQPTATWTVFDNSAGGTTTEVIQAGATQSGPLWTVENNGGTAYWSVSLRYRGISPAGTPHSVFVEEFGPQPWNYLPPGGGSAPTGESCAIVGLQSCTWNTLYQSFFSPLLSFFASQGVADASLYGTEIVGACAPTYPDNGQDNGVLATVTSAMQQQRYSLAGARLAAILAQWNTTGMIGCKSFGLSLIP